MQIMELATQPLIPAILTYMTNVQFLRTFHVFCIHILFQQLFNVEYIFSTFFFRRMQSFLVLLYTSIYMLI